MRSIQQFIKRRWSDFRSGHSVYLAFTLSFANFITITYVLVLEKIPFLKVLFPSILHYTIIFGLIYIICAGLIGFMHRRKIYSTESNLIFEQSPYFMRMKEDIEKIMVKLDIK